MNHLEKVNGIKKELYKGIRDERHALSPLMIANKYKVSLKAVLQIDEDLKSQTTKTVNQRMLEVEKKFNMKFRTEDDFMNFMFGKAFMASKDKGTIKEYISAEAFRQQ